MGERGLMRIRDAGPDGRGDVYIEYRSEQQREALLDLLRRADEVRHEVIQAAHKPKPRCRDCADHDGRCPSTGKLCDPYLAALERLRGPA